jgi:Brp/Blh family beta-carotene 15,15'-monooxygenase
MATTGDVTRLGLVGSRTVLLVVGVGYAVVAAAGVTPDLAVRSWVYLALMVGVSLPHGGYEHVANLRGRGERLQARYLAAYVGLLGAALAVFAFAPAAGLALAVGIVAMKGGHGGLHVLGTQVDLDHLGGGLQRALAVAVRGGAVMAVPFVLHPGTFSVVSVWMVRLFGGDPASVGWAFRPDVRTAVGAAFAAAVGLHLLWGYLRARRAAGGSPAGTRGWRLETAETLLLVAFFAAVPPILAVAVYFPVWYAGRQTARLCAAGGDREIDLPAAVRSGLREASLPWVGSVLVFGATALLVPVAPSGPVAWVALYSVVVSAIAVPHVLVGSWLDRRQGIWSVAA